MPAKEALFFLHRGIQRPARGSAVLVAFEPKGDAALGLVAGSQIHRVIPIGPARMVDRVVGSMVGALGLAVAVWLLLPSIAEVPGTIARQARGSRFRRREGSLPKRHERMRRRARR